MFSIPIPSGEHAKKTKWSHTPRKAKKRKADRSVGISGVFHDGVASPSEMTDAYSSKLSSTRRFPFGGVIALGRGVTQGKIR